MNKLLPRRKNRAALAIPRPVRPGTKVSREGWIACARHVLIEEGIAAVKVDRLARRLKISRGSFYHHFTDHQSLLDALLESWQKEERFSPALPRQALTPAVAAQLLEQTNALQIQGFDGRFDTAVRDWARNSPAVARIVHLVDEQRMQALHRMFTGLGYDRHEAIIRARVLYYHQIGYNALGIEEDADTRLTNLPMYVRVLCGEKYVSVIGRHATTARKSPSGSGGRRGSLTAALS